MGYLGKRRYSTGKAGRGYTKSRKSTTFSRPVMQGRIRRYGKDRFPFPKQLTCQLHMQLQTSATSTEGSFGALSNPLRLNDLSDPTGAMGTARPRWTAQLATIYEKYAVTGCKVEVIVTNAEKIGDVGMGCYDGSAPGSMLELGERENCMVRVIGAAANGGPNSVIVMKKYYDFPKIVGVKKSDYVDEDDYMTSMGSAPGNIVYWNLWHQAYGVSQTSSVSVKVNLTFYCVFKSIADPADS